MILCILRFRMPCEWEGNVIKCYRVNILPPYSPQSCMCETGNPKELARVKNSVFSTFKFCIMKQNYKQHKQHFVYDKILNIFFSWSRYVLRWAGRGRVKQCPCRRLVAPTTTRMKKTKAQEKPFSLCQNLEKVLRIYFFCKWTFRSNATTNKFSPLSKQNSFESKGGGKGDGYPQGKKKRSPKQAHGNNQEPRQERPPKQKWPDPIGQTVAEFARESAGRSLKAHRKTNDSYKANPPHWNTLLKIFKNKTNCTNVQLSTFKTIL